MEDRTGRFTYSVTLTRVMVITKVMVVTRVMVITMVMVVVDDTACFEVIATGRVMITSIDLLTHLSHTWLVYTAATNKRILIACISFVATTITPPGSRSSSTKSTEILIALVDID